VLGGVQAELGETDAIGVCGSTLSVVSENAHVVSEGGGHALVQLELPIGRYQAAAVKAVPPDGAVNVAVSVPIGAAWTFQNMNSYSLEVEESYKYWGAVSVTDEPALTVAVPESPSGAAPPEGNTFDWTVIVSVMAPACAAAGIESPTPTTSARTDGLHMNFIAFIGSSYGSERWNVASAS
jgi:hypothetical protein